MKTEETITNQQVENNNEETQLQNEATQAVNEENQSEENLTEAGGEKKSSGWKQVAIGGTTGLLFGTAGSFFMSAATTTSDEPAQTETITNGPNRISSETSATAEGLPIATVNDEMSFGQAFAAARAEVGAGGVFEWQGNIYGTYYAEEWDAMSSEERAEFGSKISYGNSGTRTQTTTQQTEDEQAAATVQTDDEHGDVQVVVEVVEPEDIEVQIVGMEHVTLADGTDATIGEVNIGGQDVYLVDVDGGDFDLMVSDLNGDGIIQPEEIADISDAGFSVNEFQQQVDAMQNPSSDIYLANDMPDYINDADPSALA